MVVSLHRSVPHPLQRQALRCNDGNETAQVQDCQYVNRCNEVRLFHAMIVTGQGCVDRIILTETSRYVFPRVRTTVPVTFDFPEEELGQGREHE